MKCLQQKFAILALLASCTVPITAAETLTHSTYNNSVTQNTVSRDSLTTITLDSDNLSSFNSGTHSTQSETHHLLMGHNGLDLRQRTQVVSAFLGHSNTIRSVNTVINRTWQITDRRQVELPQTIVRIKTQDLENLGNLLPDEHYVLVVSSNNSFTSQVASLPMNRQGAYQQVLYDFKGLRYISIGKTTRIKEKRTLAFDGIDDFVLIPNGAGLDTNFTINAWFLNQSINAFNSAQTILAKRNSDYGFEISINTANHIEVQWHNGSLQKFVSNTALSSNLWRYLSITYDGTTLKLFLDGILDGTALLSPPASDDNPLVIGARLNSAQISSNPFNGSIDELRIWNTALTANELRFLMNQELVEHGNVVHGSVLPLNISKNDTALLPWNSLVAYYSMNYFVGTSIYDLSIHAAHGRLGNAQHYDLKTQSAPLPYISATNGDWEQRDTWQHGNSQHTPASTRIVNGSIYVITWNIVRSTHDLDITLNSVSLTGLFVDAASISVKQDHGLTISHYLKLNGSIDLYGESQLVQTAQSDLEPTSTGYIERDQQGTANLFTYNYWSSPVGNENQTHNNNDFTIASVVKDGTLINNPRSLNFTAITTGNGAAGDANTAATISSKWLYKYTNQTSGQYANWQFVGAHGILKAGQGWTMKGTGTNSATQNYVFKGKPNNGDIDLNITAGSDYLVGNPYPSALDSHQFLMDNPQLNGTIYYWEHWAGNSHQLQTYQGGYAMYNLSGGLATATFGTSQPNVNQGGIATKTPVRFIPVAQGFFVSGTSNGTIKFRNDQRQFVKEDVENSLFFGAPGSSTQANIPPNLNGANDTRRKFRIGFDSPGSIHRQLLLTEDPNATTGYDRLYDGEQLDEQFDDMMFRLGSRKLAIQGIPAITNTTIIPLQIKLSNAGHITIKLDDIRNVDPTMKVYLRDASLNTFTDLMTTNYRSPYLWAGLYGTRFSIVFELPTTLSTGDTAIAANDLVVFTPHGSQTINIKKSAELQVNSVILTNMLGQQVARYDTAGQQDLITVSTASIAAGNYVVTMLTGSTTITRKVIIP